MSSVFGRRGSLLLSAYQCGPGMGSVSQIGWEWFQRLARRASTTLFTHVRNRDAIEAARGSLDAEIVYIDTEWLAGPLYRASKRVFPHSEHPVFLVSSFDFFPYDALVVREAARRLRRGQTWDVVHQVTPVSPVAPTRLHRLGLPTVLGPLNGGLESPIQFPDLMKKEGQWIYPVRGVARVLDALWGSTRNADVILTATEATRQAVPARFRGRCVSVLENGVDLEQFAASPWPEAPSRCNPLRVLFVGRMIPVKGVPMLLEAMARVREEFPVTLSVVGDGPARADWEQCARERGVQDLVAFHGPRSLSEVAEEMRRAHVFCLPSVRESGGAVLLEAMASARPVIAIAHGGPAEIVDDSIGCAIAPDGPDSVTTDLASTLRDVVRHPDVWRRKGIEGRRIAEARFSWDAKIETALGLYRQVVRGGVQGTARQPPSVPRAAGTGA